MTTFVKHLRSPTIPASPGNVPRSCRWLRRGRWRGARMLPYVDDFLTFASSEPEALELRLRVADLLDILSMQRNPAKALWEPRLARQAKQVLQRAARDARWLPVRELQSLAKRAQCLYLATPAARSYLRELHDVVGSKWGGRVRMTHQLRRDLQWWTAVPTQSNIRPIHRPVERAYVPFDSSGYALNAMLPRYNAAWLDPGCEAADSFHLSDAEWRRENDYRNPPWPLQPAGHVQKPC
eukprot:jgi/Tetstr1/425735/TSEL_016155.t1